MPSALRIVQQFFPQVKSVVDAKELIRIRVSPQDGITGKGKAHDGCALAVACKRLFHLDGAIVSTGTAYLVKGHKATRYQVPNAVSREIVSFDRGAGFAPGTYALYSPTPMGRDREHAPSQGASRKREKPRHMTTGIRAMLSDTRV